MTTPSTQPQSALSKSVPGGVYIHWPFCARKCPYCDFFTYGEEHPIAARSNRYTEALLADITRTAETFGLTSPPPIDTIYWGGGTPSLIPVEDFRRLMDALQERFAISENAEITLEVNPTAAEGERLTEYRELGVNRLSIGCQSFDDRFLRILGRDHDAATANSVLRLAREAGYDNISLDLMFGLPDQSLEDVASDLERALDFSPEHISAYGLTLHEETPFGRWAREGKLIKAEDELEAEMFELLMDRLDRGRYVQYEISNWARAGRESRHNAKYWRDADVFAFGPSAHGVLGERRYATERDLAKYLESVSGGDEGARPEMIWQRPLEDDGSRASEVMMLALRRTELVEWTEVDRWAKVNLKTMFGEEFEKLHGEGLLDVTEAGFRLTRRGVLLADEVTRRFF